MKRYLLALILLALPAPSGAVYFVRIGDMAAPPAKANPVKTFGWISKLSPQVKLSDGSTEITVKNVTGQLGQFLIVQGNWDGSALTVSSSTLQRRTYPTVLFIGDSITFSAPGSWNGNTQPGWGMNASAVDKDYVPRVVAAMRAADAANAVTVYRSTNLGQAGGRIQDVINILPALRNVHPDLITIQLGENDKAFTPEQYGAKYQELLDGLLQIAPEPRIFCFGVWEADPRVHTWDKPYLFDNVVKALCDARRIPFKPILPASQDPSTHGDYTNPLLWHPNDLGMLIYVNQFWAAMGPELQGS